MPPSDSSRIELLRLGIPRLPRLSEFARLSRPKTYLARNPPTLGRSSSDSSQKCGQVESAYQGRSIDMRVTI